MCADCHSTHLVKNFDVNTLTYNTQFSEMNVACEACHGPGDSHLTWVKELQTKLGTKTPEALMQALLKEGKSYTEAEVGLNTQLKETKAAAFVWNQEEKKPIRSHELEHANQTESCARCHAHRSVIKDGFTPPHPFMDDFMLSYNRPELYHPDGQIKEEVYVYGSFLQSKMHAAGVVCTNCHNPHSLSLIHI